MSGEFTLEGVERFLKRLDLANAIVRRAAEHGMGKAGMALLNDAIMEEPMVPLDRGTLRGSASVFVGRKRVGKGPAPSDRDAETHIENTPPAGFHGSKDEIVAVVAFNTPYAAKLHEHPEFEFGHTREKRGRPPVQGTGGKYLERPLSENRDSYMKVVAGEIKKELDRGKA